MLECNKKWPASREKDVQNSHESPSFGVLFFLKNKNTQIGSFTGCPEEHEIISLHQVFSEVSSLWKAAPFSFSRTIPCLSRDYQNPQMTEVTPNGDGLWGMALSLVRYLYSQEEPGSRYIVTVY